MLNFMNGGEMLYGSRGYYIDIIFIILLVHCNKIGL